jgi:predicted transcriptional regulator
MPSTTSLKITDALKATIAEVAAREGKTAHALMVETLQDAMDNAVARQGFYAQGEAAYQETLRTNVCYDMADVHAHIRERVRGGKAAMPKARAFDPGKPMVPH